MLRAAALALAVLVATAGCSYVIVRGPNGDDGGPGSCTRTPLVPVADAYASLAAMGAGVIVALVTLVPGSSRDVPVGLGVGGGLIVTGVVLRLSANFGFTRVSRCNSAIHRLERRQEDADLPRGE